MEQVFKEVDRWGDFIETKKKKKEESIKRSGELKRGQSRYKRRVVLNEKLILSRSNVR